MSLDLCCLGVGIAAVDLAQTLKHSTLDRLLVASGQIPLLADVRSQIALDQLLAPLLRLALCDSGILLLLNQVRIVGNEDQAGLFH